MSDVGQGGGTVAEERLAGARRPLPSATTLPSEAFTSPDVYQAEVEKLFFGGWLCVGRADQVPEPGDFFTLDLLEERLLVVRGEDGRVRVLSRVCRHRAAEVVSGKGRARTFQCPYHAWTYATDGRLLGAPLMDGAEGFDPASCRLPEYTSELWEGFLFVNLDGRAAPLGPALAPLSEMLARYRMAELVAVESAVFDSPWNWKVLVDNFMEAYHHIAIHRDTLEPIFPARLSHTPDNEGPYSVLVMPGREDGGETGESRLPLVGPLDEVEQRQLVAAVVYPFHLFAPNAQFLTWYQILPDGWDRFTLRIYTCFPRAVLADSALAPIVKSVQDITTHVHQQDIGACDAVWAGLRSRSFEPGRLSPLEKPIWQFNQWWLQRMG